MWRHLGRRGTGRPELCGIPFGSMIRSHEISQINYGLSANASRQTSVSLGLDRSSSDRFLVQKPGLGCDDPYLSQVAPVRIQMGSAIDRTLDYDAVDCVEPFVGSTHASLDRDRSSWDPMHGQARAATLAPQCTETKKPTPFRKSAFMLSVASPISKTRHRPFLGQVLGFPCTNPSSTWSS